MATSVASAAMMFVRPETAAVVHELTKRASVAGPLDLTDLNVSDYEGAFAASNEAKMIEAGGDPRAPDIATPPLCYRC
jgi:hypothetical protein